MNCIHQHHILPLLDIQSFNSFSQTCKSNAKFFDMDSIWEPYLLRDFGRTILTNCKDMYKKYLQVTKLKGTLRLDNNTVEDLVNLQKLSISYKKLQTLPKEIGQLINLRELQAHNNQLQTLPKEMGQLINLKWLYISNNKIQTLPKEICQLINLQILYFSGNRLQTLPEKIGQLPNLKIIY